MKISSVLTLLSLGSLVAFANTKDGITLTEVDLDEQKQHVPPKHGKTETCRCEKNSKPATGEQKDVPEGPTDEELKNLSPEALKELSIIDALSKDTDSDITPEEAVSADKRGDLESQNAAMDVPKEVKSKDKKSKRTKYYKSKSRKIKHVHEYEYLRISDTNSEPVEKVRRVKKTIYPHGEVEEQTQSDEPVKEPEPITPTEVPIADAPDVESDDQNDGPEHSEEDDGDKNDDKDGDKDDENETEPKEEKGNVDEFVEALKDTVPELNTGNDVELKKDAKYLLSQPFNIKEVLDALPDENSPSTTEDALPSKDGEDVSEGGALRGLKSRRRKSKKAKKNKKNKKQKKEKKKEKKQKKDRKRRENRAKLERIREEEELLTEQLEQEKEKIKNAEGLEEKEKEEIKRLERELEKKRKKIAKLEKKEKKAEKKEKKRLEKEKKKELKRQRKRLEKEEKELMDEEDEEESKRGRGRDFDNEDDLPNSDDKFEDYEDGQDE